MQGIVHPFSGALYERDGEGHIKVTRADGAWGLFHIDGRWIRGEVEECDPQLCNWVGGPQIGNHRLATGGSAGA